MCPAMWYTTIYTTFCAVINGCFVPYKYSTSHRRRRRRRRPLPSAAAIFLFNKLLLLLFILRTKQK